MDFEPILRLDLRHDFYGGARADFEVQPLDPTGFARAELLLRRDGASVIVLGPAPPHARPKYVLLVVLTERPDLISTTKHTGWEGLPLQTLSLGADDWLFGETPLQTSSRPPGDRRSLVAVRVAVDRDQPRYITLRLECEEVIWAYHVLGQDAGKALSVVDPNEVVQFADLGARTLPNGAEARVLRALDGIAARARPTQRFALQTPGNFGPQTLIEVLPAPSIDRLKPFRDPDSTVKLQADIFVTLN